MAVSIARGDSPERGTRLPAESVWAEGERAGLTVTPSHGERVQARKGAASEQRLPAAKKSFRHFDFQILQPYGSLE